MKKITILIIVTIIMITCILAFAACGDKADPSDPVVGWYTSVDGTIIRFAVINGKLVYNLQDGTNNIAVTKTDNEYTANSLVFTLITDNNEKILTANEYVSSSKHFRYLTSADKSYNEAREIYNTANPYRINEPVFGWYYYEGNGWSVESRLMHIYLHNGRIAFSHNNSDEVFYIKSYSPSTQYEGCISYESNVTIILYDPDYNGSKALHVTQSLSTAGTMNYRYITTADKTYDEALALV